MSVPLRLALTGACILQRRLLSRTDPVVRPLFDLISGADVAFTNLEVLPNDYRGDPAHLLRGIVPARIVRHRFRSYAAMAAVENRSFRTAAGVRWPRQPIIQVMLSLSLDASRAQRRSSPVSKV